MTFQDIKKKVLGVARFAFIAAIFWFLYKSGRLDLAAVQDVSGHPVAIISAMILQFLGILVSVERWRLLLRALDIKVGAWPALNLTLIGGFFNIVFPGAVGGDIVKAYYLAKGQEQKAALVTTILFDRLLGLYTVIMVAVVSGVAAFAYASAVEITPPWWTHSLKGLVLFIVALFAAYNVFAAVVLSKRLRKTRLSVFILTKLPFHEKIIKIYNSVHGFRDRPSETFKALVLSMISQMMLYGSIWALASVMNIGEITAGQYFFILPVCILINAIPVAPGGLGVGEIGFGEVFRIFGSAKGVELAVVFHILAIIIAVVFGGIAYMAYSRGDTKVTVKGADTAE